MEPRFAPAREPEARAVWETVLRPVAQGVRTEVGTVSRAVVEAIRDAFPELFAEAGSFEENLRASEANIALMMDLIDAGQDPAEAELPPAAAAYARAAVERGVPVTGALRSLRLGHAVLWQHLLPRLRERASDAIELERSIALAGAWSFAVIDRISLQGEVVWEAERDRWLRSSSALQAEVIEQLLAGEALDSATAALRLNYELERPHLAAVAWADEIQDDRAAVSAVEEALVAVAAAAGAGRPLIQARGTHSAAGWIGLPLGTPPGELTGLSPALDPASGVRVAVGAVADGAAGFRESYRQATLARRVAALSRRPPGSVTEFPRVALIALATADLDQARAFVAATLGPLTPADDLTRRLAATVQTYLEEDASSSRAARRLGVHENTVRYRMRQAEELLGRPVSSASLELQVALRIAEAAGGDAPGTS